MALVSEGQEYSSPSKRIKLDHTQQLSNYNTEVDLETFSAATKNVCDSISAVPRVPVGSLAQADEECSDIRIVLDASDLQVSPSSTKDVDELCRNEGDVNGGEVDDDDEDDDKDEISSTVSNLSNLSGLSDLSGQEWKPIAGPMSWVQRQMLTGVNPRNLLSQLIGESAPISDQMDDMTLWKIIVNVLSEIPRRQKLRHVNTLSDVVRLLKCSRKIIVLTGAGVSVSCGIPDFRSRDGIYARLAVDFPDLPDPQAMFDISYFSQDPRPFYKFAREIYPGQFKPSPCHRFIKMLEKQHKLLRNYSQNIDTLEQVAGIKNVIECHGSFATASCTNCKFKVTADAIRDDIFAQRIPVCPKCSEGALPSLIDSSNRENNFKSLVSRGIMKPDIVFFGEGLPELFHDSMAKDKDECDLLIVIGSSLKVRPVALIPSSIPAHVPQILINREMLPNFNFDVQLLGDSDVIISQLCYMLGGEWLEICSTPEPLVETKHLLPYKNSWRSNCDDSWEDRSSDPCPTDCSRDSLNVHPSSQVTVECNQESADSKNLASATTSVGNLSVGNPTSSRGEQLLHAEAVNSVRMSVDSDMGVSADSTTCRVYKQRHMSVDSSTRDSGVYLSTDNLMENVIDSSKDNILQLVSADNQCERLPANSSSSHCKIVPNSSKLFTKPLLSPDSTTTTNGQQLILTDSSRLCASVKHPADSTCVTADSSSSNTVVASITHRHMSVDSTRDSGIDGCSSIDSSVNSKERHVSLDYSDEHQKSEDNLDMLRACWEPKIRESLASRLPEKSYYFVHPNQYIFPGAEVMFDPDDQQPSCSSSGSSSDSSESGTSSSEDSENEEGDAEYWEGLSVSNEKPANGRCP